MVSFSDTSKDDVTESSVVKFVPSIRSGSYAEIGRRKSMDDEHIRVDDLSAHLVSPFKCPWRCAFYAVFDGHGGPHAASFVKRNALRFFFEDSDLPQTSDINSLFLEELENSQRKAFLLADRAMADESIVSSSCGTTALTALIIENHVLIANAGDCRAVLCRKGVAIEMSRDHRPSNLLERQRVEDLGADVDDEYLNHLSVTRSLGDWNMKYPPGSSSPLIADPEVQRVVLTEEDEFLIIGCDGIWDVMSSQCAVSHVRRLLRRHDDPELSARELVMEAIRLNSLDNLTVIVICFSSVQPDSSQRQRSRFSNLSPEALSRLRSLLEGN